MSIEDFHQGALVCKVDVEVLRKRSKRVGVCLPGAVDGEGGVINNMIIFQKSARTKLES